MHTCPTGKGRLVHSNLKWVNITPQFQTPGLCCHLFYSAVSNDFIIYYSDICIHNIITMEVYIYTLRRLHILRIVLNCCWATIGAVLPLVNQRQLRSSATAELFIIS